jgi:hypothetical protein
MTSLGIEQSTYRMPHYYFTIIINNINNNDSNNVA